MPWTRKQVKLLLSKTSPLTSEQKGKMHAELHSSPAMGHAKKGSPPLKHKGFKLERDAARRLKERARMA